MRGRGAGYAVQGLLQAGRWVVRWRRRRGVGRGTVAGYYLRQVHELLSIQCDLFIAAASHQALQAHEKQSEKALNTEKN